MANESYMEFMHCLVIHHWWILFHLSHKIQMITKTIHQNLFTGCVDVPLTKKGIEEAVEAGRRISNIPVDMIYTSLLIRVQMTAMLVMTKHRHKKVPIIIHKESDRAKEWSQVFSEETKRQSIAGHNKLETAEGKEKVHEWRRSYYSPPANGESLKMCSQRAVAYFREHIEPQL
ncbi:phosphoglycerate mutase [Gossypium australe]|uniref:phosphoglycerate mutase (2,3-diphosphoglycerate-dependent) n=1 Tax=Gossypium australe TaxID=47621 RepID=A0A5B6UUK5_9ROSI|nr:phosphoglycerate mutase [Gossypium australe]